MLPFPFYLTAIFTQIHMLYGTNTSISITSGENYLNLAWPVTNVSSTYAVSYGLTNFTEINSENIASATEDQTELQHQISGLYPGEQYFVTLLKNNASIFGQYVTTKPMPPENLLVGGVSTATINVTWTPAENSTQDEYKVYIVGVTESTFFRISDNMTATWYDIDQLRPGFGYKITVMAFSNGEPSNHSNPLITNTVPLAPASVSASAIDTSRLNISWVPNPTSRQESFLIGYIYNNTIGNEVETNVTCPQTGQSGQNFCELYIPSGQAGQPYHVRVYSVAGLLASDAATVTHSTVPRPITGLREEIANDSTIHISWTAPVNTYVKSYQLHITSMAGALDYTLDGDHTEMILTGLDLGSQYNVEVAVNSGYETSQPVVQTFYTYPVAVSSLFINYATDVTSGSITVRWTVNENATFDHFLLTISPKPLATTSPLTVEADVFMATFTGLSAGSVYVVTIQTQLSYQQSDPVSQSFTTLPSAPQLSNVTAVSSTEVFVQWAPPGGMVDNYTVTLTPVTDPSEQEQSLTLTGTTHHFYQLTAGHQYTVTLVALAGALTSQAVSQSVTTNPLAVQSMKVEQLGSFLIEVSWTAVVGSFDMYILSIDPPHTASPIIVNSGASTLGHTFQGLRAGQLYTITIVTSSSGVHSDSLVIQKITKPLPVQTLTAVADNTTQLTLTWAVDPSSAQSHFLVAYQERPSGAVQTLDPVPAVTSQTAYSVPIENLYPGGSYLIGVKAYQVVGGDRTDGDLQEINGTTKPKAVSSLTAQIQDGTGVALGWATPQGSIQDHYAVWHRPGLRDNTSAWIKESSLMTNFNLPDLLPGERYEIRVYSVSKDVHSDAQIVFMQIKPQGPTDAAVVAEKTTTDSVTLRWIYDQAGTLVDSWNVTYSTPTGNQAEVTVPLPGSGSVVQTVVNQLTAGFKYTFSIQAIILDVVSDVVTVPATTKPVINTALSAVTSSNSSVTLQYTVADEDYFDHFLFRLTSPPREEQRLKSNLERRVTFTDLEGGTLYVVEIQTVSGDQRSDVRSITLQTLPNLAIVNVIATSHSFTLEISKPAGLVTSYGVVCLDTEGATIKNVTLAVQEAPQNVSVDGLQPHNQYRCSVQSVVSQQTSTRELTIYTLQAAPSAVVDLQAQEVAPNTVNLTWKAPVVHNGELTAYVIRYVGTKQNSVDEGNRTLTYPSSQSIFTDLRAGYEYSFYVWAKTVELGDVTKVTVTLKTYKPPYKDGVDDEKATPKLADPSIVPVQTHSLFVNFTNAFSDKYGDVVQYTVIVTRDQSTAAIQSSHILPGWKNAQLDPSIKAYQAISNCSNFFAPGSTCGGKFGIQKRAVGDADYKVFELGTETGCENKFYCNGPLEPDTVYYVTLRAYTDGSYSDTPLSPPITTAKLPAPAEDKNVAGIVAGVVVAVVVVIAVILAVLFLRRRMQQKSNMYRHQPGHNLTPRSSVRHNKPTCPVAVIDFKEHVRQMSADSDFRYAEQFEDLKDVGRNQACNAAELACNRGKNRFTNILPYDHSRVKLLPIDDEEGSDYINSNYIPGVSSKREYIVSQGPLPSTRDDFWRMLWEQNTRNIVMLTKCSEKGREKCDHYWPTGSDAVFYGDLQVAILNETKFPDWTICEFRVSLGDQSRQIRHFHFTAWPDFGVPKKPQTLVRFTRSVRDKCFKDGGPIIVHCSAGVGRSGTFIVLDRLLQQIKTQDTVDIFSSVAELRRERVWMVQTEQQYVCIHECLLCVLEGREDEHIYDNVGQANPAFEDDEGVDLN